MSSLAMPAPVVSAEAAVLPEAAVEAVLPEAVLPPQAARLTAITAASARLRIFFM